MGGHIFTSQVVVYPIAMDGDIPEFGQQRRPWAELKFIK